MLTANIKSFATKARSSLLQSVENRLKYWGINADGYHGDAPQKSGAGYIYGGQAIDDPVNVPKLWKELSQRVRTNESYQDLIEEAAYTWFNRIMIIKIMEQNDLMPKILEYTPGTTIPTIIVQAKNGSHTLSKTSAQRLLANYLINNEDEKALGLIIKDLFESNHILQSIFGTTPEYFNLLLPSDLLTTNGLIHQINVASGFDKAIYEEVELIGWIYQFYIADKKDEVFKGFKKNKKARAKDIPAATQIFTPKWIVKYMVENTVGKIYLDYNPDSDLRSEMKYLVEPDKVKANSQQLSTKSLINDITELTLLDPAAGSGHILVEGFDLLMKMYKEEGYSTKQAARSIIENNLYGLDIDDRAMQLARFAVLLKASQYDPAILTINQLIAKGLKIYSFPEPKTFNTQDLYDFIGEGSQEEKEAFVHAIELLQQGKNIGSALKLDLSQALLDKIASQKVAWNASQLNLQQQALWYSLNNYIDILLVLSTKYTSVVANPPYMGQKNMNPPLKEYVKTKYPLSKSDLFAVFMESCLSQSSEHGLVGMINQHSWMFLSSYEKLRDKILNKTSIHNMLHLGPRTFDELSGEVVQSTAFVLENGIKQKPKGYYIRLVDYKSSLEKEANFYREEYQYPNIPQSNFSKIPGSPIAYWVSEIEKDMYSSGEYFQKYSYPKKGIDTGENEAFLRLWFEVDIKNCSLKAFDNSKKWFPYNKGGSFRRWYGNREYLVNWKNSGNDIKSRLSWKKKKPTIRNEQFHFKEGFSWSTISTTGFSCRYVPEGCLFDNGGCTLFADYDLKYLAAILNSKIAKRYFEFLSPTLNFQPGDIGRMLYFPPNNEFKKNEEIVNNCIQIAKRDWDSRETSWDYIKSPLVNGSATLSGAINKWQTFATQDVVELFKNERHLNQILINIYGLTKILTPDFLISSLTILQDELAPRNRKIKRSNQGLQKSEAWIELDKKCQIEGIENIILPFTDGVIVAQFISYCFGLSMGRYRLDKEGLQIAHPNPSEEELSNYEHNGHTIDIDDDAIIPLLGDDGNFPDDALLRTKQIILAIWGEASHTDNMNFLQECLGMTLDKWLTEKFWTYHSKTMYKKKPIYWLFCSNPKKPQKAAFRVLTYMHRMDKYTVQNIRTKYLHPHQEFIQSQIADLEGNEASLSKEEAKKLDLLRVQQIECMGFDDKLKGFANQQITFDLDDGVTENYKLFEGVVAEIK